MHFALGAQAVNPDVEVKVVYINTWGDAEIEKGGCRTADQRRMRRADLPCRLHSNSDGSKRSGQASTTGWNYNNNVSG